MKDQKRNCSSKLDLYIYAYSHLLSDNFNADYDYEGKHFI